MTIHFGTGNSASVEPLAGESLTLAARRQLQRQRALTGAWPQRIEATDEEMEALENEQEDGRYLFGTPNAAGSPRTLWGVPLVPVRKDVPIVGPKILRVHYCTRAKPPGLNIEERIELPADAPRVWEPLPTKRDVPLVRHYFRRHAFGQAFSVVTRQSFTVRKPAIRYQCVLGQRVARLAARAWRDRTCGLPCEIDPPHFHFNAEGHFCVWLNVWGEDR